MFWNLFEIGPGDDFITFFSFKESLNSVFTEYYVECRVLVVSNDLNLDWKVGSLQLVSEPKF